MSIDPLTQEQFVPKLSTQRFARPENRIKYHNEQAKKMRQKESFVNKPLHKNHRICAELLADKKEGTYHTEFLRGKGFAFGIITHWENYNGKNERAIYNYIWIPLEKEQIKLIKLK